MKHHEACAVGLFLHLVINDCLHPQAHCRQQQASRKEKKGQLVVERPGNCNVDIKHLLQVAALWLSQSLQRLMQAQIRVAFQQRLRLRLRLHEFC